MFRTLPPVCVSVVALLLFMTEAAAQGRGRPKTIKTQPPSAQSQTSGSTSVDTTGTLTTSVSTFRQFGSWLDDASAADAGEGRTGIGVGYWRLAGASQFNAPMVDVGYGVTDRFQVSASVPFYHMNYAGSTYRGLDDVYISGKYTVLDPTLTENEFGLAVSPVVEVLSEESADGRVHVGLPISVELRRQPIRVYGSAGYFTRGAVFTGAALEWTTPSGAVLTSALVQSYSLKSDESLDAIGVSKQRADVVVGVGYPVAGVAAVYASVGRSLTSIEQGGTSLSFATGVSFRFHARRP